MGKLNDIRLEVNNTKQAITCPLCGQGASVISLHPTKKHMGILCPNCSAYYLYSSVFDEFENAEEVYLFSAYLRHEYHVGEYQCHTAASMVSMIDKVRPQINDDRKMAEVIFYYEQKMSSMNTWCEYKAFPAIGYCRDIADLKRIIDMAVEKGYLEIKADSFMLRATALGMEFSNKTRKTDHKAQLTQSTVNLSVPNIKPYKLFISHASSDIAIVKPLVELFEGIGLGPEEMFCSSIPDYNVPLDSDIYEYLREQFLNFQLHVIFVLSDNYYSRPACLNEMGAAWILQQKYTSILVPDFGFKNLDGAINPYKIAIKLDSNEIELCSRLNELKDNMVVEFGLKSVPQNTWERKRSEFIDKIKRIS